MDHIVTVGNKSDAELARETLLIKRLRAACAAIVKVREELRDKPRRERPVPLSRLQREYFQSKLEQYACAEDPEAFVQEEE